MNLSFNVIKIDNIPEERKVRVYTKKKYYCSCGKEIKRNSKTCEECFRKSRRKVDRPSYEQLIKELEESNYSAMGRKYGVSDNSIRKWIKVYKNI